MVDIAPGDARYAVVSAISSGSIMRPMSVISSTVRLDSGGRGLA